MNYRHSVGARLLLAFGLVIVVFGAGLALSIARLSAFNTAVGEITGPEIMKVEAADQWAITVSESMQHMCNVLLLDDKAQVQAEIDAARALGDKKKQHADTMIANLKSAEDKALLQVALDARAILVPLDAEFLRQAEAGDMKAAKETLFQRSRPAQMAVMSAVQKLGEYQNVRIRAMADELAASDQSTRTLLFAFALAAVAVACVLTFLITRAFRNPLKHAVAVLGDIEKGNFTSKVTVSSQDEIGRTLQGIERMQGALRAAADKSADDQGQISAIGKAQAVTEFEMDGTVRTANENFLKTVGYALADVQGHHHRMFVDPVFQSSAGYRSFWEKLGRGEYDAGQYKCIGRGGREIWLQASYNPILGVDGKPYKVVEYATDITEQVKMKEGLDSAVKEMQAVVEAAIQGDLTSRVETAGRSGQIETLVNSVNALVDNMMKVVAEIKRTASEVQNGAEEISKGNLDLSQRTEQQASSLEETASSMEQMTATVKNNADNAAQANHLASAAREQAERGGSVVGAAVVAMGEINASSKRIADIISVIDEIAFQTNLLALNAAVEAARAGEQGRGFAVVASEVRNLASRSAEAAKEIKTLIQDSVGKVTEGTKLVDESGKVLGEIVTRVKKATDVMAEIASSSREQAYGIEQVNKAITMMDEVTQQNAALVEEASAAAQALTEQASNLTQLISRYRVGEGSVPEAVHSAPLVAARAVERRSPTRPMSGKRRPTAVPKAASPRAAGTGGEEQWKDF